MSSCRRLSGSVCRLVSKSPLSDLRRAALLRQRPEQALRRHAAEVSLLVGTELLDRGVAFPATTVAFDEDAGYDDEEDEGEGDGESDEDDEAAGETSACLYVLVNANMMLDDKRVRT